MLVWGADTFLDVIRQTVAAVDGYTVRSLKKGSAPVKCIIMEQRCPRSASHACMHIITDYSQKENLPNRPRVRDIEIEATLDKVMPVCYCRYVTTIAGGGLCVAFTET